MIQKGSTTFLMRILPKLIGNKALIGFLDVCAFFSISKRKRIEHLRKNEEAFLQYEQMFSKDRLIEHQAKLTQLLYGNGYTADYNSCEVIAVYNAITDLLGRNALGTFPQLLVRFEEKGIACRGAFGTSILELKRFFELAGMQAELQYLEKKKEKQTEAIQDAYVKDISVLRDIQKIHDLQMNYEGFLMTSYNDANDLGKGIHTMYISKEQGGFVRHNDYQKKQIYASLLAAIESYREGISLPITVIGVKR